MSSLVEELQRNIVNEGIAVSTILRQIKLAAAKLRLPAVEQWVDNELNGYKSGKMPQYRTILGNPRAHNPYNGWIPILFDNAEEAQVVSECALYHPISVLEGWTKNNDGPLRLTMGSTLEMILRKNMRMDFEVALFVDPNSVKGVISAVRNKALDWVIELEKNSIIGDSFSFSEVEKERAQMTINNFGQMSGAIGSNNKVESITVDMGGQVNNLLSQAQKYQEALVKEGVDADALAKSLARVEAAIAADKQSAIKSALETFRSTLGDAAGGAIATGLLQMIHQLL